MVSVLALSDQTDILVIKRYFSSHDWLEEYLFLSINIFQNNVFWLGKVLFVASLCRWSRFEQIRVFMWYNKVAV